MCFPLWTFVSSVVDAFVHSTQKSHKKKTNRNHTQDRHLRNSCLHPTIC
jgi:hypothetical protein